MTAVRIEQRAAKVSLVTGFSTVLSIVFQLISVPVCLRFWGGETYGRWLALFSAFLLLRSLDTGYTVYVGNELNYLYHEDRRRLRLHLASAAAGIAVISALQLAIAVAVFASEPLAAALGMTATPAASHADRWGLLILLLSWVATGSYLGIVHRLLIPAGLMYQAAWWATAFQVTQFCAIMAAAVFRLGMLQTSVLFAVSQFFIYVSSAWYVRRALPEFSPWLNGMSVRTGLSDLGRSTFLTASNLIQQGSTNGLVLLVASLAGAAAVPVFTTVRTLANLWTSVTTVLTGPLLGDVVRLHAKEETRKLVTMNQAYWVIIGSAVNLGALLSYPLIPFVYGQWTRHEVPLDTALLCFMLASVVVANAGGLIALHVNGINRLPVILAASVVRAGFALGIGALGHERYGLASFGIGIVAGEVVASGLTAVYFFRREIHARGGIRVPPLAYAPIGLSTGATLAFFLGAGTGLWAGMQAWIVAIAAVCAAAALGWKGLDAPIRGRLQESFVPKFLR